VVDFGEDGDVVGAVAGGGPLGEPNISGRSAGPWGALDRHPARSATGAKSPRTPAVRPVDAVGHVEVPATQGVVASAHGDGSTAT